MLQCAAGSDSILANMLLRQPLLHCHCQCLHCTNCRLNRSFISLVGNARDLHASLVATEKRSWCCVWDKDTCLSWDTYLYTTLQVSTSNTLW